MVEKITAYLGQKERDYHEGLILLSKNSKNRILLQRLSRKAHPEKLEYELKKIAERLTLIENAKKQKESKKQKKTKKQKTSKELDKGEKDTSADDSTHNIDTDLPVIEKPGRNRIVRGDQKIKFEDLPAELQAKWEENTEAYKISRSLHEKLKLMEKASPEDRKPLIEQFINLADQIRANWNVIDAWDPTKVEDPASGQNEPPVIDHKRIQSNRTYISKNLKKLQASPDDQQLRQRIQERITELVAAGETFKDDKLKDLGFEL